MIRVLIADDTLIARAGWKMILEFVNDIEIIDEVEVVESVPRKMKELRPDVLLLDLKWFDNEHAGAAAIAKIKRQNPEAKIIAVTAYPHLAGSAREAGADAVLPKGFSLSELESVIRAVYQEDEITIPFGESIYNTVTAYAQELASIERGRKDARRYEVFIEQVLTFLLEPHLTDPRAQSQAAGGTQIRDVTFFNSSRHAFWAAVRQKHGATQVVFEAKNVKKLTSGHIRQLGAYLKDILGSFGIIVTRAKPIQARVEQVVETYKAQKKIILILSDEDIKAMLEARANADDPTDIIKHKYLEIVDQV